MEGLKQDQPARRVQNPDVAQKIDEFLYKLVPLKMLDESFKIVLDDPSGNSFIENPCAPKPDPNMTVEHYTRTRKQDLALGISAEVEEEETKEGEDIDKVGRGRCEAVKTSDKKVDDKSTAKGESVRYPETTEKAAAVVESDAERKSKDKDKEKLFDAKQEVVTFLTDCPNCGLNAETHMKNVEIPHFKEVIIMATSCDRCGFRDNEVKAGAGIEEKGKKITLRITDNSDLTRDVLKSETAGIAIPELEFSSDSGTLGGRFTTLEGLLNNVKDQLVGENPFLFGDSSENSRKVKMQEFCDKLQEIIDGKKLGVHFIIDDPAGNSYVQNFYAPDDDPEMEIEFYVRNFEQNEVLGLNDMKTENYEDL